MFIQCKEPQSKRYNLQSIIAEEKGKVKEFTCVHNLIDFSRIFDENVKLLHRMQSPTNFINENQIFLQNYIAITIQFLFH